MLHWLYPRICAVCGEPAGRGLSLCEACRRRIPRLRKPICLHCGTPLSRVPALPGACDVCRGFSGEFDFARSALRDSPEAHRLAVDLKYHRAPHLADTLAGFLNELWEESPRLRAFPDWHLVPVPMTFARLHRRGYNQSEELARALGRLRGLRTIRLLVHDKKDALSQTFLDAPARARHAFQVYKASPAAASGRRTPPPRLLLIDDVWTTGATIRACARSLKRLPGVQTVGALTVLRVEKSSRAGEPFPPPP